MCFNGYRQCYWLITLFLAIGCEEVVEPSLITTSPILVVEAHLSDIPNETVVKLTTTAPFNDPSPNPPVTNATVQIRNDPNNLISFFEQEPGIYTPIERDFVGREGGQYSLSVKVGRVVYSSLAYMPQTPKIDSLSFAFEARNIDQEAGYYVSYHYQDPISRDYHLLEFLENGVPNIGERFEIRSDRNVNGKYLRFKVQKAFNRNDTVTIITRSLTEAAYKYFEGLNLLAESGSPSQAVPENPNSNISSENNPALGIFYATTSASESIVITP